MTATLNLATEFAPAERMPVEIVRRQAAEIAALPLTSGLLNAVFNYILILNAQRQIVFATDNVRRLMPGRAAEDLLGLRPGEALSCLHAGEHAGGCGTSRFCSECGAVKAILTSLGGSQGIEECHLLRRTNAHFEALDLLVHASPFQLKDETFSLVSLSDISHQKRRQSLERIFFHDLINLAGGLEGLLELVKGKAPELLRTELQLAGTVCHDLLEQIESQRALALAENHELTVNPALLQGLQVVQKTVALLQHHQVAKDRRLTVAADSAAFILESDELLLQRVLSNLIKNALEASRPGEEVVVRCATAGKQVQFSVHNPGVIPLNLQLQMFNRSFTTKGAGRGLGTYSVKLLVESYLQGTVKFVSTPEEGTTFYVTLPKSLS